LKRYPRGLVVTFTFIILIASLQIGCKENTLIDARIDPNHNTGIAYSAVFNALTKTVTDDSVITSTAIGGIPMFEGVGSISASADPFFGSTFGSTYFQVIPSTLNFSFDQLVVDSAVLILPYSGTGVYGTGGLTWGDTTNPFATQTYKVYIAKSSLSTTVNYYPIPMDTVPHADTFSGTATVNVNSLEDSVNVNGVNQAPHLRIRLDRPFINMIDSAGSTVFTSNANFLAYLNGICVVPDISGGLGKAMPYFRLDESGAATNYSKANILLYYHVAGQTVTLDSTFSLYFDGGNYCAHYNYISRGAATSAPPAGVLLLQDQPGDALDVKIYGLRSLLVKDPVSGLVKIPIINKAELDLPIVGTGNGTVWTSLDSLFYGPPRVYALGVDSNGNTYTIADRFPITSTSALGILDGTQHYNAANNITMYQLNIPREVQNAVISGRDTLHLRINGTQDYYGAYRAAIGGGNYSDTARQMKLKVVYSKLK